MAGLILCTPHCGAQIWHLGVLYTIAAGCVSHIPGKSFQHEGVSYIKKDPMCLSHPDEIPISSMPCRTLHGSHDRPGPERGGRGSGRVITTREKVVGTERLHGAARHVKRTSRAALGYVGSRYAYCIVSLVGTYCSVG